MSTYEILRSAVTTPAIFTKSGARFWDDPHISGQMLQYHLNPDLEAASKTAATIEAEARYIIDVTGMDSTKTVVDLGCGPGLYAARFAATGAAVTGIDMSERSIAHAREHVGPVYANTRFIAMNYLDLDIPDTFDIATMIFYDFCVLNPDEQQQLLARVNAALKTGGRLVFDVVTENRPVDVSSTITPSGSGFWSPRPYIEILHTVLYEAPKTEGIHYTIIEEDGQIRTVRLYHRLFGRDELSRLLEQNGFRVEKMLNNLQGDAWSEDSPTWGIFARKV